MVIKRSDAMMQMKSQFAMSQSMRTHFTLVSAKASGDTGVATVSGAATITMKPGKDGKAHTVSIQMQEKETWIKSGGGWKIKMLEVIKPPQVTAMDGRPMSMGGPGRGH